MEIVYCDACGLRIASQDAPASVTSEGKALCANCRPQAAPEATAAGVPIPAGLARPAVPLPMLESHRARPLAADMAAAKPAKRSAQAGRASDGPRGHPEQRSNNNSMLAIGGGAAVICVLGLFFVFSSGGAKEKVVAAKEKSEGKPEAIEPPLRSVAAPPTPAIAPTPAASAKPEPQPATDATMPGRRDDPDAVAQKAYDHLFDGMSKDDTAGKIKRLEQFVKEFNPEALAAARARIELERLKKPPTPATPTPPPPAPAANSQPATPTDTSLTSYSQDFEAAVPGLRYGKVAGDLPGGNSGKAMKLMTQSKEAGGARGGIFSFDFPSGSPQLAKGMVALMTEGARVRFRYYNSGAGAIELVTLVSDAAKPDGLVYRRKFNDPNARAGAWIDADFPLSDLTAPDGKKLGDGMALTRLEFWAYPDSSEVYIDDLTVLPGPQK